ncbi:hypothetical protein EBR96_04675, partial [bacterium]|nr:hypothetical protein [bacterium]
DIYWDNLFGTGQLASVKAQLGRASTYSLRYMNPWMWDKRKSFSITAWLRDGQVDQLIPNSSTIGYRNERSRGLEMEVGWPFSYEFLSSHRFKYESVLLKDVDKSYTITSYALTLAYDTRDVRFNPLSGEYYTLTFEDSLPVYKSSLEYYRIVAELRNFTKVAEQQTIATRLVLGYINSPSISDTDLFSREYFRMGGSSTVRGWNDFYPFGTGNKEALFSIEYRYVFNDTLTAVAFVDVGSATSGSIFDTKQYHLGKGVGIRFTVPALGPIRLDWGIGDYGDSILHASIGHTF